MIDVNTLERWLSDIHEPHIVVGYGSLMNTDSRQRFSAIPHDGIPVELKGFTRAWVTRSQQERQTYVGAMPDSNAVLNAQLLPSLMDPSLAQRERDYQFVSVSVADLHFDIDPHAEAMLLPWLETRSLWVCETLLQQPADEEFPVHQTYIDTCLAGCIEHAGDQEAVRFIETTQLWDHPRINDRGTPVYPRAGRVSADMYERIDRIMGAHLPDV
ncbi:gamma-glutamylcyclotransferase [Alteromonas sp. ASW11-19]|uniref:Gamma-glutamylcyclotransferase n=1 Tax=Alteromonas salexigens TaxID=2982530 RepID=A0ABT2VIU6_9ALTE|nr:gamma-glutamylcyclotransferase [Alteromonas salexigens]MCU7553041.1 gamma-glutamylcyclotransferase [Alteromonas salexigens]